MSSESKETFVARCRNKNKCSVALQSSDTSSRTSHVSNNTEAYPGSKRGKRGPHLIQNDDRYLHATLQLCVCVCAKELPWSSGCLCPSAQRKVALRLPTSHHWGSARSPKLCAMAQLDPWRWWPKKYQMWCACGDSEHNSSLRTK